jgi:hypothetical protein
MVTQVGKMKVIKGVLEEELENSIKMKAEYEKALAALPKGALVRKEIHGHFYYYLMRRQGSKIKFDYLGKLSDEEIKEHEAAQSSRAQYRKLVSQLNKQIAFLRKALRGKEIRSLS